MEKQIVVTYDHDGRMLEVTCHCWPQDTPWRPGEPVDIEVVNVYDIDADEELWSMCELPEDFFWKAEDVLIRSIEEDAYAKAADECDLQKYEQLIGYGI